MNNGKTTTNLTRDKFNSLANVIDYAIDQKLLGMNTITVCKVVSYDADLRSCTVIPVLNGIDGAGNPILPPTQYTLPIKDVVGNGCGIEIEYAQGDIVEVSYSQRDLTSIKNWWANNPSTPINQQLNPNSYRLFNLADGIVTGHVSNQPPTIKIRITSAGIDIEANDQPITVNTTGDLTTNCNNATLTAVGDVDIECVNASITGSSEIDITAPTIKLDGAVQVTTTLSINGIDFATHTHSGVTTGGGVTGPVV